MRDKLELMISWARAEGRPALVELLEELQRARRRLAELDNEGPRRCCSTCRHWDRGSDAGPSGARECLVDRRRLARSAESSCPDRYEPLATGDTEPPPATKPSYPGVSVEKNVIRATGDEKE